MLLLLFATAFIGYVLPWGQMSYWGATVITNLFSAIPLVGQDIVHWLWGGFSVANATLNRFYSLHFFLPFILLALTVLHIFYLHIEGSSNSLGLDTTEWTNFYPYFFLKDLFSLFFFSIPYFYMVFFHPNYLSHPDNFIEANPLVTPTHIVPEWYFLPFYAILRSIPDKLGGVLCMIAAILILLILPIVDNSFVLSMEYYPFSEFSFYMFICSVFVLGWLGTQPIEPPFIEIAQQYTFFYFSYFLLLIPGFSRIENWLWFGNSKKSSVLKYLFA
jgi:ubiquinol-cytochrome c reductase cytochrome b subunit